MRQRKSSKFEVRSSKGRIFVLSGPSGSGKTTLAEKLLQEPELKARILRAISFTTRPKRSGERNKKDYLFITQDEFRRKLKEKKILEWTKYLGYYYATSKDFVEGRLKKSRNILLCLDLKGAARLKKLYPKNTLTIFIIPPSIEELQDRIVSRCNRTKKEEILGRLKLAKKELSASHRFDFRLVNKNLQEAVRGLKGIIVENI